VPRPGWLTGSVVWISPSVHSGRTPRSYGQGGRRGKSTGRADGLYSELPGQRLARMSRTENIC